MAVREVPIETLYFDHNAGTHFRPITDSIRVLLPVLLFACSSLAAFAVDTAVFVVLYGLTASIPWSIAGARVLSAGVNFVLNGTVVFRQGGRLGRAVAGYVVLALGLLAASIAGTTVLADLGLPAPAAKLITEAPLFVASYHAQRRLIFAGRERSVPAEADPSRRHNGLTETSKVQLAG